MKGKLLAKLRKSISALLALVMALALVPMSALAATAAGTWKITDAEGTEIAAGEDGTIAVPSETDATDGKAKATFKIDTGDADTKNYYIFDKVDDSQYYVLATVADTAITLVTDEAVKTTANIDDIALDAGVFTATLKNAAASATLAAGPSAEDVIDFTIAPPAAKVEDNKVTVEEVKPDDSGKVETTVEVKDDAVADMITAAAEEGDGKPNGTVEIIVPAADDAGEIKAVEVSLPNNVISAAKDAEKVHRMAVDTPLGYVNLPVADLDANTKISITTELTVEDNAIKAGIALELTKNGETVEIFSAPVDVSFGYDMSSLTKPVVAFVNQLGAFVRTRCEKNQDGQGITFRTRHFSEYVLLDEEAEGVNVVAAEMKNQSSTANNYAFNIEMDETLVTAGATEADGAKIYMTNDAPQQEMWDETRKASASVKAANYAGSWAIIGEVEIGEDGMPVLSDQSKIIGVHGQIAASD